MSSVLLAALKRFVRCARIDFRISSRIRFQIRESFNHFDFATSGRQTNVQQKWMMNCMRMRFVHGSYLRFVPGDLGAHNAPAWIGA